MLQPRLQRPLQPVVRPQQLVPQLPRPAWRCRGLHRARYFLPGSELPDLVLERLIPGTMLSGLITGSSFLMKELSRQTVSNALMNETCRVMNLQGSEELQDTLAALVLSECVYKKVEMSNEEMVGKISEFLADFPPELVHLEAVQCSLNDLPQNYLVAVGSKSVYVAFMGTKQARDMLTDAAFFHEAIWGERSATGSSSSSNKVPTAHRGFLARSKSIDVEALYQMALDSNRHLVLCGHSLGGAVAKLCTLRLLRKLPEWPPPQLRCICFAAPAVGNSALAKAVEEAGWDSFFKTYALPEDQLMQVLHQWWQRPMPPPSAPAAAAAAAAAAVTSAAATPAAATAAAPSGAAVDADRAVAGPLITASSSSRSSSTQDLQQQAGQELQGLPPSSSGSTSPDGGGQAAVSAVVNVLALPFRRESAKQQLRRELQAEERSTTPQDAAALDAADASAGTSGGATTSSSSPMAAAGMSYDSPGPAVLGLPARPAIEAVQAVTAPHRRLQDHQQQQQEEEEVEAAVSPLEVTATTTTTTSSSSSSRLSSSARTALSVLGGQVVAVPGHMALLLDLQRRWAGYQLARMGQAAQDSFSTASQAVSSFVPFGQQWYLTSSGAVPLVPLPPRAYEPTSPDAQDFLAKHPGMFSFHRMVAYRSRCLALIQMVRAMLEAQGLKMAPAPAPGTAPRPPLLLAPVIPGPQVLGAAVRLPLGGPRGGLMGTPWEATTTSSSSSSGGGGGGSPAGTTYSSGAAGGWRSRGLAFLPGGRKTEELVSLTVVVRGLNLHQAKYMSLSVFGEAYIPVDTSQLSQAPLPPSSGSSGSSRRVVDREAPAAPTSGSSSTGGEGVTTGRLGRFAAIPAVAYVAKGVQQAGVALSRIAEGGRPAWRQPPSRMVELQLQVQLPLSVVERLCAGTAAATSTAAAAAAAGGGRWRGGAAAAAAAAGAARGSRRLQASGRPTGQDRRGALEGLENSSACGWRPSPSYQQQQQQQQLRSSSTGVAAAVGSPQQQQQQQQQPAVPALLLQLRSDFETVGVEVAVAPWKVGIVGTNPAAALALQQLLSGATLLQPASALAAEEWLAGGAAAVAQGLQGPAAMLQPWAGAVQAAAAKLWPAQWRGGAKQVAAEGAVTGLQPPASQPQLAGAAAVAANAGGLQLPPQQQQQQQQDVLMADVVDNLPRSLSPQWVEPWLDGSGRRPTPAQPSAAMAGAPASSGAMAATPSALGVSGMPGAQPAAAAAAATAQVAAASVQLEEVGAAPGSAQCSMGDAPSGPTSSISSSEELQPSQQPTNWWSRLASGSAVQTVAMAQAVRLVNHATGRAVHLPKRMLQDRMALHAVRKKRRLGSASNPPSAAAAAAAGGTANAAAAGGGSSSSSSRAMEGSDALVPTTPASASAPMEGVEASPVLVRWGGGSSSGSGSGVDTRLGAGSAAAHPLRPLRQPASGIPRRVGLHSSRPLLRRGRGLAVAAPALPSGRGGGSSGRYGSNLRSTAVAALHAVDLLEGPGVVTEAGGGSGAALVPAARRLGQPAAAGNAATPATKQGTGASPQLLAQLATTVGGAAAGLAGGVQSAMHRAGTVLREKSSSWGNLGAANVPGSATMPAPSSGGELAAAAAGGVLPGAPHVLVGVVYQPLPNAASAAARSASRPPASSSGAPHQRSWWPLVGGRRPAPPVAPPFEASPQQILRLAARQLLRSQASSWSWAGVQGWAPRAVKGLVGVVSSSWNQKDLQPACDAWSAWKGGMLKLAGMGPSSGTSGSTSSRAAGLAAAAAALPAGVLEGQQQLYLQQRLEAAAQVEGGRVAVAGSQSWDVLLLAVPWDASFPALLAEPALSALVSAAEAAGVPLVPVLVQQGPEEVLLVTQPLKGASAAAHRRAQAGRPGPSSTNKHPHSQQQVAWRWEEAAGQLAEACGVPVTRVCSVQLGRSLGDVVAHPGDLSGRLSAHQQQRLQEQLQQVSRAVAGRLSEAGGGGAAAAAAVPVPPHPRSRL